MLLLVFGPFTLATQRGDDDGLNTSLMDIQVSTTRRLSLSVRPCMFSPHQLTGMS